MILELNLTSTPGLVFFLFYKKYKSLLLNAQRALNRYIYKNIISEDQFRDPYLTSHLKRSRIKL